MGGIGLGDAAQANVAMGGGRQDDVVGLDAREFFEHGARGVAEARTLLPRRRESTPGCGPGRDRRSAVVDLYHSPAVGPSDDSAARKINVGPCPSGRDPPECPLQA